MNYLIDEKPHETNDQLQINFVIAFEQAYIQIINEQLQAEHAETDEEAEEEDSDDEDFEETPKQQEPKQPGPTSLPTNDLFDRLKKEIEVTQKENTINLMDNEIMDQKIKNSKLQNNQIKQLQIIHRTRLTELQGELYEDNVNTIARLDNINDLNRLFDDIKTDKIMTPMQISILLQLINGKILKIRQEIEFNEIKTGIENETDTAKLEGEETFNKFKKDIENEAFIGNLLDGNLFDTLISNDALLSDQQKKDLQELRRQRITTLNLHILRRHQLDKLRAETKDELFDTLSELLDYIEDLEELTNESQILSDIKALNQTLLINGCYIDRLDKKRKTCYYDNLYDNIETSINIETKIKKLQDDWKIKIDTEIDQTFLTPPRSIEKLHQLREFRIVTLQKPDQPKRPAENENEEFLPTRISNNAKPVRNANGNINVQITFIIDEYKCTLNIDDKKKFNRIKTDHVKKLIKDAHAKSKAKKHYWIFFIILGLSGTKCKRLEKDPKYKDPAQYPVLFGPGGQFSFNNPLGFPVEIIDEEENIKQIINQYQLSLKNQSDISINNLKKMQDNLINELDDVEEDDDINNVFDSLNFVF
ncbi:hypothetical protein F8M41_020172 [Gigaspora margarita]|uniref:Uncharacterized protein n=1 Tax=Gigaspora margarita TaxID=4874 RepID=A0A8H4AIS0_GIGMA|nr:hypothetical protein F8M41_020172 [Gigaspora margarita]